MAVDRRVDHVGGIGGHAVAHQLGEDRRAARFGMLIFLEQQDAGALGQHGSIALLGKGPKPVGTQHAHRLPGARGAPVQRGFGRAGDTEIDQALADHAVGEADRMRGGRARAYDAEGRPLDAVLDRDMRGGRAADSLEQGQRMGGALILLEEHLVGEFERGKAADARADDAGRAIALLVVERCLELAHGDSFLRRAARVLGIFVSEQKLLALQPLPRVEVRHLAGDGDVEIFGREALHLAYADRAALQRGPEFLDACAQRSDDALAGDHDASAPISVCHVVLSRNSKLGRCPTKTNGSGGVKLPRPYPYL